jgi:hypothetical protein
MSTWPFRGAWFSDRCEIGGELTVLTGFAGRPLAEEWKMHDVSSEADAHEILLEDGPDGMPVVWRVENSEVTHVKLPRWSGVEHYEFRGDYRVVEGRRFPVFQWVYSTKVAE